MPVKKGEMKKLKCAICKKESAKGKYCRLHQKAYENIARSYNKWRKALEVSWKEYLSQIADNPLTGEWTREVVQHVMKSEGQVDVKEP
jgi:hypothetical protein